MLEIKEIQPVAKRNGYLIESLGFKVLWWLKSLIVLVLYEENSKKTFEMLCYWFTLTWRFKYINAIIIGPFNKFLIVSNFLIYYCFLGNLFLVKKDFIAVQNAVFVTTSFLVLFQKIFQCTFSFYFYTLVSLLYVRNFIFC